MTIDKFYKHIDQHKYGQYLNDELNEALKVYADKKLFYFAPFNQFGYSIESEKQFYILPNGSSVYEFPYEDAEIVRASTMVNCTLLINGKSVYEGMRLKKGDRIQVRKDLNFPDNIFIELFLKLPVYNEF